MTSVGPASSPVRRVLSRTDPSNRWLRIGLGGLAAVGSLIALFRLVTSFAWAVDLEIPLRAADRWLAGGQPYLAEAFAYRAGYDLPFLYPPYALPIFAPLTVVARAPLEVAWFAAGLVLATATCRRLGIESRWIPLVLAWPPFAEGLISGNIQIAIFAAFVVLFGGAAPGARGQPPEPPRSFPGRGLLGAATTFLKVSQPHVVVHMVHWDRRAAIVAVGAIVALVVVSLPLTGTSIWIDWVDQLKRAADPAWTTGGPSLSRLLPTPIGRLIVVACIAAVLAIPPAHAAAGVGILLVVGAPSVHTYYLLFLLPAMLRIRLELSLLAAILVSTYTEPGLWLAIAVVAGAFLLSRRFAALLEHPGPARPQGPESVAAV
jgi:Glycosyltransferase family 87